MKKYLLLSLAIVVMIAAGAAARLANSTAPATAVRTVVQSATSASLVDQGKSYLANHNILAARDAFQQAVAADPTDQTAQFFYGVTRIVAVYEDGQNLNTTALDSVRDVLEQCGFVFGTYGVYDTTTTKTPQEIAATTPNTGAVIDFLATNLLPQIDGAITNLAAVSNTAFNTTLDTAGIGKTAGSTITVDYADVVMLKTLLYGLKCQLKLIQVYGLDFSPPQMTSGDPRELMRYRQLLQNDATLLAPKNPSFLTDAKAALVSFIDTYGAAIDTIRQRATQTGHLFVLDQPLAGNPIDISSPGVDEFRSALAEVKASLAGPHLFTFAKTEDQYRVVDLSVFFNAVAPLNPRQLAVDCGSGVSLPDPTFGGLLPLGGDMTGKSLYVYKNDLRGVVCSNYTAPKMSLSDPRLVFGDMPAYGIKSPASRLSIKNIGTGDLNVASLGLIGGDAASFTLQDETCGGMSPTLSPGQKCSVIVDFAPAAPGTKSAAVQATSNDPLNPNAYTQLTGMMQPLPTTGSTAGFKSVVPHPTNSLIVYAANYGEGVFKSSDAGAHWSAINSGLTDKRVTSLVMQPGTPTTLLAGTLGGGIFRSTDGGVSWAAVNNGLASLYVNGLAVTPATPFLVYAVTHKGIFRSTDGGTLWTAISMTGLPALGVTKLVIDPTNQAVVYTLVNGLLCKTGDGGSTWTILGDTSIKLVDFALAPSSPQTVYASSYDSYSSMVTVYRSTDGGQSWTKGGSVMSFVPFTVMAVDLSTPQTVYLLNNYTGLYKSIDGGTTWSPVSTYPGFLALVLSPVSATVMFAGDSTGVAISTDGGVTWSETGFLDVSMPQINVIRKDPVTPTTLYAAGNLGVLKSTDDGTTWAPASNGFAISYTYDLLALPGRLVASTQGGLYTSTDGGDSWTLVSNTFLYSLAATTGANPVLYGVNGNYVLRSNDNGATWTSTPVGVSNSYVTKLAVSGSTVYAGTSNGLYKSADGGVTWNPAGLVGYGLTAIFVDPENSSTLYAGTYSGVFKSTDGSATWNPVNSLISMGVVQYTPYVYAFAVNPATPSTLYALTGNGLYRTTNGGASWAFLDLGGIGTLTAAFPAASGKIVVGGSTGIYLLPIPAGTTSAQYNLAVTLAGTGAGSISYSAGLTGASCASGTCTNALTEGTQVTLTPVPNAGSVFTSWAGCDAVSGETCSVSMYGARNVTATFSPDPEPLTALASPPGGSYPVIQSVYLAASKPAVIHYTLDGTTPTANSPIYSGPLTISGPSTTLKYYATAGGADSAVKTESYSISQYSLTVNRAGTGTGAVNSITTAYPFSCAESNCSANFPGGAQLTLHATPAAGFLFDGWSGACSGNGDCLLTILGATGVTATFNTVPNVRIPLSTPVYFATLQAAIDAATGSAPIQAVGMEFVENLFINRDGVDLILKGGYDTAFSSTSGMTYLDGILTIGVGSLTLENFVIK